ncbi:MAG: leucine-rich repeat domain-containing protein [Cruoricaptor ignavus]|nr:leucine-rich repeat domain-containing protein [Cruoricaptor ignavus]
MRYITLLFFVCNFCFAQQIAFSSSEKAALISLYHSLDGENWSVKWDLTKDPKNWYGIKTKNGNVTEIYLNANNLKGEIPTIISSFQNLEILDLSSNNLKGEIPTSISSLSNLNTLNLSHNRLEGNPQQSLNSLSLLQHLYLGYNNFVIPDFSGFLQNLPNLYSLDIANTGITTLPNNLASKSNLTLLNLSNNTISNGWEHLSQLKELKKLHLANTGISKFPSSLASLTQLHTLDIGHNSISDFTGLANLKNLDWISLENNGLEQIPNEVFSLQNLVHINLNFNQIKSISTLTNIKTLQQIFANSNTLSGDFPSDILSLQNLQMISLNSNDLSGAIPQNIPAVTLLQNNKYDRKNILNFISNRNNYTLFDFSPQRYDEPITDSVALGKSINLQQSLSSGDGYTFTWLKHFDEYIGGNTEQLSFDKIEAKDYADYTVEAYSLTPNINGSYVELSLFREPITLVEGENLATDELAKGLAIYPNPTKDFIYIKSDNIKIELATLYDMSGKVILQSRTFPINVRAFPTAAYFLVLKTELGEKVYKIIKN